MRRIPKDGAKMIDWALYYASMGWAVFPIQPGTKKDFYHYPEFKNPESGNEYSWKYQASTDEKRVRQFWEEHPDASIGCATGQSSGGLYVLDLDRAKGETGTKDGREHFISWQKKQGRTANTETPVSKTGCGGNQLFYHSDEKLDTVHAAIFEGYGVDTRGDGGFVVLPPSIHPSGNRYEWKQSPDKFKTAEADDLIRRYWRGDRPERSENQDGDRIRFDLPETIGEGARTQTLVQYVGSLVSRNPNLSDDEIRGLVSLVNDQRCEPPLDYRTLEREVMTAIRRFKARQIAEDFQEETATAPEDDEELLGDDMASYALQHFEEDVESFKRWQSIKTGYKELDDVTGGLYAGLYVVGAVSALGKTTFLHQMADQIAASGQHVIYFSLEQSRAELLSKSLAREIILQESEMAPIELDPDVDQARNALQVRKGEAPDIKKYIESYVKRIESRLTIREGNLGTDIKEIRDYTAAYIRQHGVRPVVIVDYLQIIANKAEKDPRAKIEGVVKGLKIISRDLGVPLLAISNMNRENYLYPVALESFKESGLIEYTADVVLGLQLQLLTSPAYTMLKATEITKKREAVAAAMKQRPREIALRCLKNRYGGLYSVGLEYYPDRDLFLETWSSSQERAAAFPNGYEAGDLAKAKAAGRVL